MKMSYDTPKDEGKKMLANNDVSTHLVFFTFKIETSDTLSIKLYDTVKTDIGAFMFE